MFRLHNLIRLSHPAAGAIRRLRLFCDRPTLHPGRALLTPTWLLALVVLALNDHLLKGAGVLPGAVTGKLSDFAGMIVAPVLLAALLRVRSRRGLLACSAAVGAVFAGINLSHGVADAWSWLMGFVWPWHITVDPTDLVALPALALGWRALVPAMSRPLPALSPMVPRVAEASAVALGSFFCVATSEGGDDGPDSGDWGEETSAEEAGTTDVDYEDLEADVYLHNAGAADIRVRTRGLRPDVQLDCFAVELDPGLLLSESLFGEGQTVSLPPSTNTAVRDLTVQRDCHAVRVEGDAFAAPFVLFWDDSDVQIEWIDGDIDDPELHTAGAVLLAADADQQVRVLESRSPVVFSVRDVPPEGAVYPGPDEQRLAWSDPPFGEHQLLAVEVGPDGCVAATVAGQDARWYLCVPEGAFPFAADQWIRVDDNFGAIDIRRVPDPQDPIAVPFTQLTLSRGGLLPTLEDVVLAASTDYNAVLAPEPTCGTVASPVDVSARYQGGEVVHLRAGDQAALAGQDRGLTLWVAHAEERVVLDPTCALGPDELAADIEVAALITTIEP
jgi:hypothetical protein